MPARTVVCPGCRTELKLKTAMPAGVTEARCPVCKGRVPLAPAAPPARGNDSSVVAVSPDDTTGRSPTRPAPPGPPPEVEFSFLAPPQRPDELGRLGPYRVLAELGRGGMGVVFRAEDPFLRRVIALKVMLPQYAHDATDKARFLREARAQAQVEHEHVASIFQVDEDRGVPFLAMPLLKGQTLGDALKASPCLPLAEAVRIAREMAEGLAAAHEQGLVHRDIKPGNVWLEGDKRRVKILDFGLARRADVVNATALTDRGAIIGTPAYMSPEQARGAPVDARSDLFSLGTVFYQALTGHQPFRSSSATGVLIAVATEDPPSPSALNAVVPAALDAVAMALLAKDPTGRPASADEVAERLRAIERGLVAPRPPAPASGIVSLPIPRPAHNPWTDLDRTEPAPEDPSPARPAPAPKERTRGTERRGRSRAYFGLFGLVAAIAVVGAAFALVPRREPTQKAPEPVPLSLPVLPKNPATLPPLVLPPPTVVPDRRAAEYVLSAGGNVRVNGRDQDIREKADLPREPFRLTSVSLDSKPVTAEGLAVFQECSELTRLVLHGSPVTDAGLAHFKNCKNLKLLNLNDTKVTDAGLGVFRECKGLTELDLGCTTITDAGLEHFRGCDDLTSLNLSSTPVGDAGMANFKGCKKLSSLSLRFLALTDAGLAPFSGCADVTYLDLCGTKLVGDAGLANFKECKTWGQINLESTRVTSAGMIHFRGCDKLIDLYLGQTQVGDEGLVNFKECKDLAYLGLSTTTVGDEGLAHFRGCKKLKGLYARETRLTDAALVTIETFVALEELNLQETKWTEAGLGKLKAALPGCKIEWDGGVIVPKK